MNNRISFATVTDTVKKLLLLNGVFLLGMALFRLAFFLYYRVPGVAVPGGYVLKAFFMGARFDLVVVAYLNTLVTLTLLLVWASGRRNILALWLRAVKYYYFLMYSAVFFLLCVDFGFYSYFKNHLNILIFGVFEDDTGALFSTLAANYNLPLVVAGFIALFALVYLACRFFLKPDVPEQHLFFAKTSPSGYQAALAAALVLANAVAARGSFGMFPLGTMDAEVSPDVFINKVAINGLFTLQEAVEYRMKENRDCNAMKMTGYDGKPPQAFADFLGVKAASLPEGELARLLVRRTPKNPVVETLRPNVVVIMMEGFGADLARYQSADFNVLGELKKHFDADIVFRNFLSGDVGTIGSLETVLMNLPKRPMAKPVSQSQYAYRTHPTGAAWPYKKAGYDTVFLYGGNTGWRNALNFIPTLGFDTFEGEGSMDAKYLRNQWGVYDEYLFDYLYGKLARGDGRPKFIFAMTTTNHPPYSLPPDYRLLPLKVSPALDTLITGDKKMAMERFKTYQYANQKLGELITRIKNSPLGNNTIVAVTGDHNFWSVFDYPAERYLDLDGVPFYLYIPPKLRPASVDAAAFGSHVDIMPTLYNLSLSGREYLSLGTDLLNRNVLHTAYNVDGLVLGNHYALRYSVENGAAAYFAWDKRNRQLVPAGENDMHRVLLARYKAALAVTDYLIREPAAFGEPGAEGRVDHYDRKVP